jgi:hypothetical protein
LKRTKLSVQRRRLKLGIPFKSPVRHHWTEAEEALLGEVPDQVLAKQLGVTLIAVIARRSARGVYGPNTRREWVAAEEALLGTRPDAVLAKKFGRTVLGVAIRRRELRIPIFVRKAKA